MASIYQSASAAFSGATVLLRSIATKLLSFLDSVSSSKTKFIIAEESEFSYVFQAAEIYLRAKTHNKNNQVIADSFENIRLRWRLIAPKDSPNRRFELTFPTKFTNRIADSYIPCFMAMAEEKNAEISTRHFNVQESFETVGMHEVVKRRVMKDLDLFVGARGFYREIGKPWKRSYLLLSDQEARSGEIAAMANHVNFDVCRFSISDVYRNSDLKRILSFPSDRNILLFVDMDCRAQSSTQFSLLGMLNLIHVLWSRCGDNRILVLVKDSYKAPLHLDWMDAHICINKMIKMFDQKPLQ